VRVSPCRRERLPLAIALSLSLMAWRRSFTAPCRLGLPPLCFLAESDRGLACLLTGVCSLRLLGSIIRTWIPTAGENFCARLAGWPQPAQWR
jgi:hypothetical protein